MIGCMRWPHAEAPLSVQATRAPYPQAQTQRISFGCLVVSGGVLASGRGKSWLVAAMAVAWGLGCSAAPSPTGTVLGGAAELRPQTVSHEAVDSIVALSRHPGSSSGRAAEIARHELRILRATHEARRASIVVLDPTDGRVLAAVGEGPAGDAEASREVEMGSAVKPLTVAAALDAGLDPRRRFAGEGGVWGADDATLVDAHPRPSFNAAELLASSSNVGAGKIVAAVGAAPIAAFFERCGVEPRPGASWVERGAGIGVAMTAVELAAVFGAFANRGIRADPSADGRGRRQRLMRASTAATVRRMLEGAVSDEGTGRRARVEGQRVAGKTGTTRGGAVVFAGFAPVDRPRFVVVVRAEVPEGWGGTVAAPAFSRIMTQLLAEPESR